MDNTKKNSTYARTQSYKSHELENYPQYTIKSYFPLPKKKKYSIPCTTQHLILDSSKQNKCFLSVFPMTKVRIPNSRVTAQQHH